MSRLFLDANVFIYAIGVEHPLRGSCGEILRRISEGKIDAVTSVEVVQEVIHVLRRRGRGEEAVSVARSILSLFPDILPVSAREIAETCTVIEEYPEISTRDALHVATMRAHGLDAIVTADRHFDLIDGLQRIDPRQLE